MTVSKLVRFGRQLHRGILRQWSQVDEDVVTDALTATGLTEFADRPLQSMSGGQRPRAWIAMALAQSPPLLLLDTPTSALHLGNQVDVFELIRSLAAQGKTVVMVVHDLTNACRYADHIVAEGALQQIVTPALVDQLNGVRCVLIPDPHTGTLLIAGLVRA